MLKFNLFVPLVIEEVRIVAGGSLGTARCLQAEFGFVAPGDPQNRYWDPAPSGYLEIVVWFLGILIAVNSPWAF